MAYKPYVPKIIENGASDAPILVVVDPPSKTCVGEDRPISWAHYEHFAKAASKHGFSPTDFAFVTCGPFVPDELFISKSKCSKYLKEFRDGFLSILTNYKPKMILSMGNWAATQLAGRSVQITKVRGQAVVYPNHPTPIFHMYNCGFVLRSPNLQHTFEADFRRLAQIKNNNWNIESVVEGDGLNYQWCTDLTDWLNDLPAGISFDTEGTGLDWYRPEVYPFTLQLCREAGSAIMIPLVEHYYPELERDHKKLKKQVKSIMENEKVRKAAHNFKYDYHMLRKEEIIVEGWAMDTSQAMHAVNENMKNKSLDECVRMFVPEMAGYADIFNREVDKSQMIHVPKDKILRYGCGDADAGFRLAKYLRKELAKDKKQLFLFENVQMPALRAFADTLEYNGVHLDECKLQELVDNLGQLEQQKYNTLIKHAPGAVKKKHLDAGKALSFTRDDFIRDILFSKEGFKLKPQVFTKTSAKTDNKIPSTSAKDHLSYFKDFVPKGKDRQLILEPNEETGELEPYRYVDALIDYKKLIKMRNTYVGFRADEDGTPSGFWQYIYDGRIHPSYDLSVTVTGRSNSRNPNGQNLPKRGKYAKMYRKIFYAPEGWTLIQADYSQAELRVVAWHANEPTMIQAYRDGKDLHSITAAASMQLEYDAFMALEEDEIEMGRYRAKSQNFGLIYGMSAAGYKDYAYTNYGLVLSQKEAEETREIFFSRYKRLPAWHEEMIEFAHEYKYVRSLHGACRHLPDIDSKDFTLQSETERMAINSPIQRFASDLGVMALLRIYRDLKRLGKDAPPIKPCMFIHDANVYMVRNDYLAEALPIIKFYMESNPLREWFGLNSPVPILADLEAGPNLATLAKQKNIIAEAPCWYSGEPLLYRAA